MFCNPGEFPTISAASMWTRKDIKEFKDSIRKEGGDAIIKVGHGETVTVSFIFFLTLWNSLHDYKYLYKSPSKLPQDIVEKIQFVFDGFVGLT